MQQQIMKLAALTMSILMLISSCTGPGMPGITEPISGINVVTGKVTDAQGHPVSGARIRAENPNGSNIHIDGFTGTDGKYTLTLTSIGGWKIYAWKDLDYKGKSYHLRMGMTDDANYASFNTGTKALVKDFVWKLSGRIPDRPADLINGSGYFGASMRFVNHNNRVSPMVTGTKVTVTLTPVNNATYLDGTPATAPVVKTFNIISGSDQNYYLSDIPVTEYRLSIQSELNGAKKQVYVGGNSTNDLYEWLEFEFKPAGGSGSYESGLYSPNEFLYYMGQKK